jgi:hypothetical protein
MQYHLRTLLILLAVGPPLIAGVWLLSQAREQTLPECWFGSEGNVISFPPLPQNPP